MTANSAIGRQQVRYTGQSTLPASVADLLLLTVRAHLNFQSGIRVGSLQLSGCR